MDVEYHEGDYGHWIEPAALAAATRWLGGTDPIGLRCELVGEGCPERLGVVRERLARGGMVLPVRKRPEEVFLALTVEVDRPESSTFSK